MTALRARLRASAANVGRLVVITVKSAIHRDLSLLAAGLAFFALMAMAPFLVVAVAAGGALFGADAARAELYDRIAAELGPPVAEFVTRLAEGARELGSLSIATLASALILFWSATRLLAEVRRALHTLWDLPPRAPRGWRSALFGFLRGRLLAALGTLVFGAAFLALLATRVALAIARGDTPDAPLLGLPGPALAALETALAFALVTALVALVYRLLPDRPPHRRALWSGAALTAGLLLFGRSLVAAYLATGAIDSAFGAAGALVIFLVWAYYNALAFLLGARLTHLLETRAYRTAAGAAASVAVAPLASDEPGAPTHP